MTDEEQKPKARKGPMFYGGIAAFIGGVLLLIAFSSPYWLKSYDIAYLDFKNMGLWEFCFHNFRFPYNQFDYKFNGCHYVFSDEYRILREWILPAWLQVVQAFVSLAFLASFTAQVFVALILMRWPLGFWRQFGYEMTLTALLLTSCVIGGLFLAVAIFGGKCWDREWLMYPNYNYLSWSYYMAIFSLAFHVIAALFFIREVVQERTRRLQNPRLYPMSSISHLGSPPLYQYNGEQYNYPGSSIASQSPTPYGRVSNVEVLPAGDDGARY